MNSNEEKQECLWQNESSIKLKESKTSHYKSKNSNVQRFFTDYSQSNISG